MPRLAFVVLALGLSSCGGRGSEPLPTASPGLELQPEGYARAREGFRTRLVRRGPAPQTPPSLEIPEGAREVEYRSDALKLRAVASPDPGDGVRRPAVLFLHGGFGFGRESWEMSRPYREAGYVVMTPVLRGENGQPGEFTMFFDEVEDILAAAETLSTLPYVSPDRIFIAGHSAGGTLALLSALASKRFRAAAAFSGDPDQLAHTAGRADLLVFDPTDIRELRLRSSVAYATSFKCPARLYYGDEESLWAEGPNRRTAILARRAGLDVEAVEVSGDHGTSVAPAIRDSIRFFKGQ
jgi:dipeptidyl aminopeptidase/acylaminoacyl peptidase